MHSISQLELNSNSSRRSFDVCANSQSSQSSSDGFVDNFQLQLHQFKCDFWNFHVDFLNSWSDISSSGGFEDNFQLQLHQLKCEIWNFQVAFLYALSNVICSRSHISSSQSLCSGSTLNNSNFKSTIDDSCFNPIQLNSISSQSVQLNSLSVSLLPNSNPINKVNLPPIKTVDLPQINEVNLPQVNIANSPLTKIHNSLLNSVNSPQTKMHNSLLNSVNSSQTKMHNSLLNSVNSSQTKMHFSPQFNLFKSSRVKTYDSSQITRHSKLDDFSNQSYSDFNSTTYSRQLFGLIRFILAISLFTYKPIITCCGEQQSPIVLFIYFITYLASYSLSCINAYNSFHINFNMKSLIFMFSYLKLLISFVT